MKGASGRGLIIAAPASASGKTIVTIGLIAALRQRGLSVAAAKCGPDYIDTAFLSAATGEPATNLDSWAMRVGLVDALARRASGNADILMIEGVMGLFDGGAGGQGSTAELACALGLRVVLVIDASRQAQSAAALAFGFANFDPAVRIGGVILNRVASARHEGLIRAAFDAAGIRLLGVLPRARDLELPSRHLGLVQAGETGALGSVINEAGDLIGRCVDLDMVLQIAEEPGPLVGAAEPMRPPGQRVAVARDAAFGFAYEHVLAGWRAEGAEIVPFSPLADEAPERAADAIFLPGGYPELHAGRLAANRRFIDGLGAAARAGASVFGECGGYMVMGTGLTDADGVRHKMAGLFELETSFADRHLHLGYRRAILRHDLALAPRGAALRGHEFHYATVASATGEPLFDTYDGEGNDLGTSGLVSGRIAGSFLHLIDVEQGA